MGRQAVILIQPVVTHAPWDAARRANVLTLTRCLPGVRIVDDVAREGVWATTRRAWLAAASRAEWALVIQDDAQLAPAYYAHAEQQLAALAGTGAEVVSHYGYRRAAPTDQPWYLTRDAISGVALMMRSRVAREFVNWADRLNLTGRPYYRQWSDVRLGLFLLATSRVAWVCNPSLADHDTAIPSLIGGKPTGTGRRSLNPLTHLERIDWTPPAAPVTLPVAPATRRLYQRVIGGPLA